jgi:hypothetical protein
VRTIATFTSTYQHGNENPPGKTLADLLRHNLSKAVFPCELRAETEYAHTLVAQVGKRSFLLELALVDEDTTQWFCHITSRLNILARIVGADDEEEEAKLVVAVDACLKGDAHVADVCWHEAADWDGETEGGADVP